MFKKLLAMLMALMMLCGAALAESTEGEAAAPIPGNVPQRGLILPMTEADQTELNLATSYMVAGTSEISEVPVFAITFTDDEGIETTMLEYAEADLEDEATVFELLVALFSHSHPLYNAILYTEEYYNEKLAEGKTAADIIEAENAVELGRNDGYVYVGVDQYEAVLELMETDTQKAAAQKAIDRCKELIANISFQPIVFDEGEFTEVMEGDLTFSTQDLNGNTVTHSLFQGKKLTVLNVWGTHCTPCINEMPELAEWSQNMPEGVQLVGLVSDLRSAEDADILETAQLICEATGATVYTNLIANADFAELLSGVVGVPTTFFIDGTGAFVGDPIVGANVPACKAFVEEYLAE